MAEYVPNTTRLVESYGGRYLARTTNFEKIEGDRSSAQLMLLIEWPSREAAVEFYESDEYRPYSEARRKGSICEFTLVPAEDVNSTAGETATEV
ncbi:MAG: DUF1330 domain-containing protein [Actinomycetota bacterium]|nr:DUF1330 domain-containing protein [Actinomycetota bacterium]